VAATQRPPRIVAELGRPETPEETAARKAENSRKHRANQTLRNLVLALLASLGIVLFLVLVVVRPDHAPREPVDYIALAEEAEAQAGAPLIAPELSEGWTSNAARLEQGNDDVTAWVVGFLTPSGQFIELRQGIDAGASWAAGQVDDANSSGGISAGGLTWKVYDRRDDDAGNYAYSMTATSGDTALVLHGTANDEEFGLLAAAVGEAVTE
jgi:hypothetical protein